MMFSFSHQLTRAESWSHPFKQGAESKLATIERAVVGGYTPSQKKRLQAGMIVALFCLGLIGCGEKIWNIEPVGKISSPDIIESSGLVASRRYKDVLWTHNDSDNAPQIFAIRLDGTLIRAFELEGTKNVDWEDLAIDSQNRLYILDNTSRSSAGFQSTVYVFAEPNPFEDTQVHEPIRQLSIRFPDRGYDCEAIFIWAEKVYLVTKPWDGSLPRIYRCGLSESSCTAEFLGVVPHGAMITAGDISEDGRRIVLLSYRSLMVFEGDQGVEAMFKAAPLVSRLNAKLLEGVAWKGDGLALTNEERDVYFLQKSDWVRGQGPFRRTPTTAAPFLAEKPTIQTPLKDWAQGSWLPIRLEGRTVSMGRLAWSHQGLHFGLELPAGVELAERNLSFGDDQKDWFRPGNVYLLLNPDGERPLVYGRDDRCVLLCQFEHRFEAQAFELSPATWISNSEIRPDWLRLEKEGSRLLATVTAQAPGFDAIRAGRKIGFNVIIVGDGGGLLSWASLTKRFTWDTPSIWGLVELTQ